MRQMNINKSEFYYSNYVGIEPDRDDEGRLTGTNTVKYTPPKLARANISASRGSSAEAAFGVDMNYDRVMSFTTGAFPITETTVIWIDSAPPAAYNFRVARVAKGLNETLVALRRVDNGTQY